LKRFEFRLQKLLEIRKRKEEQEKLELAKASGAYQFVLNKKEKILFNLGEKRKELSNKKGQLNLRELQAYDSMVKDADLAIKKLDVEIEEKRKIMQKHIDKYAELKRERRVVEVLREKAYKKYEEEAGKEEQKLIDEIGKDLFIKNKENRIISEN